MVDYKDIAKLLEIDNTDAEILMRGVGLFGSREKLERYPMPGINKLLDKLEAKLGLMGGDSPYITNLVDEVETGTNWVSIYNTYIPGWFSITYRAHSGVKSTSLIFIDKREAAKHILIYGRLKLDKLSFVQEVISVSSIMNTSLS